jgi:DNA-binding LytR/AlgR family response regulator
MINKPLCCIVDDEESSLASLKDLIEEIDLIEIEYSFLDPDKFLMKIDSLKSEIIFLDIEMPIYGIDVASKLKDKLVVFVSGHTEKAFETYNVNAIDFVPKPIRGNRLKDAIEKVLKKVMASSISLRTENANKEEIIISEIAFISTCEDPRDKYIQLSKGKKIKAKNITINNILKQLPNYFLKVNPSEIINVNAVHKRLNSDTVEIETEGGTFTFVLGDKARIEFFKLKPNLA